MSNIHALWDSVLYEYSTDRVTPLSDADWQYLGTESARLTGLYPASSIAELNAPYTSWDDESF